VRKKGIKQGALVRKPARTKGEMGGGRRDEEGEAVMKKT